ncbi:MAG TPA: acetate kinase [bacterium]|nr:acetate kinase [bacterium]HXK93488.1 acetate kinase [bacterium]
MKIFVLNCGSSSVKFQLIETDLERISKEDEIVLARGIVEKIGLSPAIMRYQVVNKNPLFLAEKKDELPPEEKTPMEIQDHGEAITSALKALTDPKKGVVSSPDEIAAVGHRVVHGGERFKESVVINEEVLKSITACVEFAPLHNPHNLRGYYACKELLPHCPHVAIFDTAFHQSMPRRAFLYGLPYQIYQKYGIRRYGFHGVSHRYVSYRLGQLCGTHRDYMKVITCHLGNGCSCAAIDHGKSIDTSMGFTPLEGLLMGTRTGDLDPSIILTLIAKEELALGEANNLMNKHSGLLGISGVSSDMREIQKAAEEGNERAQLAIDMFCYRMRKYIAAYAASMGGVDHVVFTGGIGENSPLIRKQSCEGLQFMGIEIDDEKNEACAGREGKISLETANVGVWAIPTNEELVYARDTVRCISGQIKEEPRPTAVKR